MSFPAYAAPPAPRVPDLPPRAVEYQQALRGPRHRWWRPLASFLVLALSFVLANIVIMGVMAAVVAGSGQDLDEFLSDLDNLTTSPVGFTATNAMLAALIPIVLFAIWLGHTVHPRWVHSVTGRFRWGWFARCLAVLLPLWAAYVGLGLAVDGIPEGGRPREWVTLLLVMLLTTPLQAAGEEYAFRGWLLQSIGSWFGNRWVALVVPMVLSCVGFAAAHGSGDPWVIADLCLFAVTACLLTWRTGGLEAAVALHCLNNMLVMGVSLVLGGFEQGFIDQSTTGSPVQLIPSALMNALAYALVAWQARRTGVARRTEPQIPPPPVAPYQPSGPLPSAGAPCATPTPGAGPATDQRPIWSPPPADPPTASGWSAPQPPPDRP